MTEDIQSELDVLENEISAGQDTFIRVGEAIRKIQEKQLYKLHFKTFEEYCKQRWGWTRIRAYQLIEGSKAVASLPNECKTVLYNSRQASAIAAVPTEDRVAVVEAVAASGAPVTAKAIEQAATEIAAPEVFRDKTGYKVPDEWVPLFKRDAEVLELRRKISEVRSSLKRAEDNGDILYALVSLSVARSELDAVYSALEDAVPFAVCCFCQGVTFKQCRACRGRGVISKRIYNDTVPEDYKTAREKECVKP